MPPDRVVLLVDDVELMTAIAGEYLGRHLEGATVVTMTRPQAALEWLKTAPRVDLVLSDNHMGDMDGLTLLKEAKALHPACARALMTAYLDIQATPQELGAMGVHALLRKPWQWPELARFVRELLGLPVEELARRERDGPAAFPEGAFAEFAGRNLRAAPEAASAVEAPLHPPAPRREEPPAPPPAPVRARRDPSGRAHVACPHCRKEFELETAAPAAPVAASSPTPAQAPPALTSDDEEARRLLAHLRARPGVERRMRAIQTGAAPPARTGSPDSRVKG